MVEIGGLKKVVKDMGVIGISNAAIAISGLILIPVLTKNLGAYGYGLWSQVLVTISITTAVITFGIPISIVRLFPGRTMKKIGEEFTSLLILILLAAGFFSVLLYLFPNYLSIMFFDGNITIVKIVAIIIFAECLNRIFRVIFQAFREMKKYAIITVLINYSEIGLAVFLVILGYGVVGAIIALLIVRGIFSFMLFIMVSRKITFRKPNKSSLKEYFSIGLTAMPGSISHLLVNLSDRYVIGFFLGATFVGYYAPSYALGSMVPTFLATVLGFVLLPTMSNYYENNNVNMVKNLLNLSTKYFLIISVPVFIGIIMLGKPILLLVTTKDIANEGYLIIVLSSFASLFIGIYEIFKQTIFLKKNTKLFTLYWGIAAIINLIGNIIFIPKIGIVAAGITTIISYFIVTILVLKYSFDKLPIKISFYPIIKIIISSSLMGIILYTVNLYLFFNLFFFIIIGISSYFSILYLIGGFNKNEIRFFKEIFLKT